MLVPVSKSWYLVAFIAAGFGVLFLVVGWFHTTRTLRGWRMRAPLLLSLSAAADSAWLLSDPNPVSNHLFQLLTALAVVLGVVGLFLHRRGSLSRRRGWALAPASFIFLGTLGLICEYGIYWEPIRRLLA